MKIFKKVVIDIATLRVIEKDVFTYHGPIAHCGGGGGGADPYDKEYNARMAKVAERQQGMADEYFKFWETHAKPYEKAQYASALELLPGETETRKEQMKTEQLGLQTRREEMGMAKPVMEEYYKTALEGVDVGEETRMARADVAQGIQESEEATERSMSRMGVDPLSGRFAGEMKATGMEKAKAVGGAMSGARRYAKEATFKAQAIATQGFKGGINY
jgi:hypothetical protein